MMVMRGGRGVFHCLKYRFIARKYSALFWIFQIFTLGVGATAGTESIVLLFCISSKVT